VIHTKLAEIDTAIDQIQHRALKSRPVLETALLRHQCRITTAETTAHDTNGREQKSHHLLANILTGSALRPIARCSLPIGFDRHASVPPHRDRQVAEIV
jgi:hypothetical protein